MKIKVNYRLEEPIVEKIKVIADREQRSRTKTVERAILLYEAATDRSADRPDWVSEILRSANQGGDSRLSREDRSNVDRWLKGGTVS